MPKYGKGEFQETTQALNFLGIPAAFVCLSPTSRMLFLFFSLNNCIAYGGWVPTSMGNQPVAGNPDKPAMRRHTHWESRHPSHWMTVEMAFQLHLSVCLPHLECFSYSYCFGKLTFPTKSVETLVSSYWKAVTTPSLFGMLRKCIKVCRNYNWWCKHYWAGSICFNELWCGL